MELEGYRVSQSGIHYETRGAGPQSVILVHGLPSSHCEWERMALSLAAHGYRSIALDLPGHGESFKPARAADYQAEPFYAVFEAWMQGLALPSAPVLLGHSFGGYLCLRYALDHPQAVRALMLINPFLAYAQMVRVNRLLLARPEMAAFALKHVPSRLMPPLLWAGSLVRRGLRVGSYLTKIQLRQSAVDFKRCSPHISRLPRTLDDLTPRLASLELPTFLLWGRRDPTLAPGWYAQAAALMPHATCRTLNAGHNPQMSNFEEVRALVLDYLNSIQSLHPTTP